MERDVNLIAAEDAWDRAGLKEIPVLDLGAYFSGDNGDIDRLGRELKNFQENIGFFCIKNHGISSGLIDRTFSDVARFHAQSLEEKLKLKIDEDQIGYIAMGGSHIDSSDLSADFSDDNKPDMSEGLWVRRERDENDPAVLAKLRFQGLNKWPSSLPGFRENIIEYVNAMENLGRRMLPIYARALDLELDYFDDKFDNADIPCRLAHYPPNKGEHPNQYGVGPHTDAGFLTLLPLNVSGLEVRTQFGDWISVPVRPGEIVVNGGESLVRFTNGRFIATPHRVIGGLTQDRYTMPLFFNPNFDAVLSPVHTCVGPDTPSRFEPQTYMDYILSYLAMIYSHQGKNGK